MTERIKEEFYMNFKNVKFLKSVFSNDELPKSSHLPEIAVAGRSNVGKSSLLNHLFGAKLVKISSTPGKTRSLNFFSVDDKAHFVDLPGYGFAKVAKEEKRVWGELIETYLDQRVNLRLLLLLLDCRREPTEDDLQMLQWIEHRQIPSIAVITKIDKVKASYRYSQVQKITGRLKGLPHVNYSVILPLGRLELIAKIRDALA